VNFTNGYSQSWTLEFNVDNLFPRRYLAVCHISPVWGGIYDIYVNNQLVRTFNYGTEISAYKVVNSVIPGKKYYPKYEWTKFDFWVNDLEVYGNAKIKLVYRGPGTSLRNGIGLDYIDFIPY
jgi:hypothetical protein